MSHNASSIAGEYETFSIEEHMRKKGMWAGSLSKSTISGLQGIINNKLVNISNDHTPALIKIIDEGLVNASDHDQDNRHMKKQSDRVSYIKLNFGKDTNIIEIENDGVGIPIIVDPKETAIKGRNVYIPENAFGKPFTGRNMTKQAGNIKGGINGIGGKLINSHSDEFIVTTIGQNKDKKLQKYVQRFSNGMRERDLPTITDVPANTKTFTNITFRPTYKKFGYKHTLSDVEYSELSAWCQWRIYLLSAYVGKTVKVYYNDVLCNINSSLDILKFISSDDESTVLVNTVAKSSDSVYKKHPWDIAFGVMPSSNKFKHVSIINGVQSKGAHLTYIKNIIVAETNKKYKKIIKDSKAKKLSMTDVCKNLVIVISGALPGADWGGQRKDELQISDIVLKKYKIPPKDIDAVVTIIVDLIMQKLDKKSKRKSKITIDKYIPAVQAGGKNRYKCGLLTAEGDSAIAFLEKGLTLGDKHNPGGPSFKTYGVLSLGGVVMNAMKHVTIYKTLSGKDKIIRSEVLKRYKLFNKLVEILGLDYQNTYENKSDIESLNYGCVIAATDQDLDGTGKIWSIVMVWFHLFWPNLIKYGFLKKFMTPIVRVQKKKGNTPKMEFIYENEFDEWLSHNNVNDYKITYYKGLASHDETNDIPDMFRNFSERIYTFTLEDSDKELFEIYFGKNADLRKKELETSVDYLSYYELQEIHRSKLIPCSVHLKVDTKAYKLDDNHRKIPSVMDGLPVTRRKILKGAMRLFSNNNALKKIFQVGGNIAEHENYHHGDVSLYGTITSMAQKFPNSNNYPYLIGSGLFGSRKNNGDDAGSARYIRVKLANKYTSALFPKDDSYLLPYEFDDGERSQPKYYVGTLPTALLESFTTPSEGWKHVSFARDLDDVLALTKAYVSGNNLVCMVSKFVNPINTKCKLQYLDNDCDRNLYNLLRHKFPLRISLNKYGNQCEGTPDEIRKKLIRMYKGQLHSFGNYYLTEKIVKKAIETTIIINELPIREPTGSYTNKVLASKQVAPHIKSIKSFSSDTEINIIVTLLPGSREYIEDNFGTHEIDPFEDFFKLRKSVTPLLNYYNINGGVLSYGSDYHSLFFYWADMRKKLYIKRFERIEIILQLKIMLQENIVRFIQDFGISFIKENDEDTASHTLAKNMFPKFNHEFIKSPKYAETKDFYKLASNLIDHDNPNASYDYLFNLKARDGIISAKNKRIENVKKMKEKLENINKLKNDSPFPYASVWMSELEEAENVIKLGNRTDWKF